MRTVSAVLIIKLLPIGLIPDDEDDVLGRVGFDCKTIISRLFIDGDKNC